MLLSLAVAPSIVLRTDREFLRHFTSAC